MASHRYEPAATPPVTSSTRIGSRYGEEGSSKEELIHSAAQKMDIPASTGFFGSQPGKPLPGGQAFMGPGYEQGEGGTRGKERKEASEKPSGKPAISVGAATSAERPPRAGGVSSQQVSGREPQVSFSEMGRGAEGLVQQQQQAWEGGSAEVGPGIGGGVAGLGGPARGAPVQGEVTVTISRAGMMVKPDSVFLLRMPVRPLVRNQPAEVHVLARLHAAHVIYGTGEWN